MGDSTAASHILSFDVGVGEGGIAGSAHSSSEVGVPMVGDGVGGIAGSAHSSCAPESLLVGGGVGGAGAGLLLRRRFLNLPRRSRRSAVIFLARSSGVVWEMDGGDVSVVDFGVGVEGGGSGVVGCGVGVGVCDIGVHMEVKLVGDTVTCVDVGVEVEVGVCMDSLRASTASLKNTVRSMFALVSRSRPTKRLSALCVGIKSASELLGSSLPLSSLLLSLLSLNSAAAAIARP